MRTKLSDFCDKILEAGWLSALVIAPLFFNVYSDRVFEPDKLTLVRSIALVMAVAWLTKVSEPLFGGTPAGRGRSDDGSSSLWAKILGTPLVLPTLLMVAVYIVSTALSVVPRISFWGSYQRLQGTYTTFSYIVIFFMVLSTLRRRQQLHRLINTIVLTSLPIAIYGILQHYQRDPLPWGGDVTTRVASNMGNAIFLAAYLIMAFFLTLERLVSSFSTLLDEEKGTVAHALLTGAYMAVLLAQVLCIFFTQSRGPWLGLLAGLYVFVLLGLVSLRRRSEDPRRLTGREMVRAAGLALASLPVAGIPAYAVLTVLKRGVRWMWLSWVIQAVLGVAFLVVFNIPGTPLDPLREAPYIGRLGQVFEMEGGTGRVRILIWEGAVELLKRDVGRAVVGYGPEAMYVAYNPVYPPELAHYEARNAAPDRSHNETFDVLITTGFLGFVAYIFLFGSAFHYGLKWLGLVRSAAERNLFIVLAGAGAVAGVVLPWALEGTLRLAGVGLAAGFIVGVIVYITMAAIRSDPEAEGGGGPARQLVLIALLSTLLAHFVEIHFGIAIASTRVYFWTLAAVMVAVGLRSALVEEGAPVAESVPPQSRSRRRSRKDVSLASDSPGKEGLRAVLALSVVVALILAIAGYDYITNQSSDRTTLGIIGRSLTALVVGPGQLQPSFGMMGLFGLTWIVGGILTVAGTIADRSWESKEGQGWGVYSGAYAAISLLTAAPFMLWHASRLRPYAANPANNIVVPYVATFVLISVLALVIYWEPRGRAARAWGTQAWAASALGAALSVVAILLIVATNVNTVKADVYYKQGKTADARGRWDASISYHERAISLAPTQDFYYLFLGRAQLERAQSMADPDQRRAQIERSLETLEKARELNPLNTDHTANLGRLYRIWGQSEEDPTHRNELFETALGYYVEATELSPHNAGLFNEWGLVYYLMGRHDEALEKYRESLALDTQFDQTYLLMGDVYLAQKEYDTAIEAYQQVLELSPDNTAAHSALGYLYAQVGEVQQAIDENLLVLKNAPDDYVSLRNLTLLLQQTGDYETALQFAERALPNAPEQERPSLQHLIDQLQQQAGG